MPPPVLDELPYRKTIYSSSLRRSVHDPAQRRLGKTFGRGWVELHEKPWLQHLDLDHDQLAVAHDAIDPRIKRQLGQRAQGRRALLRHLAGRHLGAARGAEARVDPELAVRRALAHGVTEEPV